MKLVLRTRDLGNTLINTFIVTWLYKYITHGHDLTFLDTTSLVLVIPTTIFTKIITGKKPTRVSNMTSEHFDQLLAGEYAAPANVKADFDLLNAEVFIGVTLTTGVIAVVKISYKISTGASIKLWKVSRVVCHLSSISPEWLSTLRVPSSHYLTQLTCPAQTSGDG